MDTNTGSTPLRFLVADDSEDIRELLVLMVERLGHSAHQARDGAEAIELLAVARYDFMLLDLTMPRMSGQDVLRWLRQHPEWAHDLRVVVVSARGDTEESALEALGAHAVLPKPMSLEQLRHVVEPETATTRP